MREYEDNPDRMEWFEYMAVEMDKIRVKRGISDQVIKMERYMNTELMMNL